MQQTPAFSHFWKQTTAASVFGSAEQRALEASLKFSLQGQKTKGWEHSLAPLDPTAFCCNRAQGFSALYSQCFTSVSSFARLLAHWRAKSCAAAQSACSYLWASLPFPLRRAVCASQDTHPSLHPCQVQFGGIKAHSPTRCHVTAAQLSNATAVQELSGFPLQPRFLRGW